MIDSFDPLQQRPGSKSCLPTAVAAILRYYGRAVSVNQVSSWCQEGPAGCVIDLAMDGLRDHDCEVTELTRDPEIELRESINDADDPAPVLVTIKPPFSDMMDHAVVVLGMVEDECHGEVVRFMDPLTGSIKDMKTEQFFLQWDTAGQMAFIIR